MDLYVLDSLLRRTEVIDHFESLIWTERFCAFGDFQFVIDSTSEARKFLTEGTWLAINESQRVMVVETIEGKTTLTVSGRSLEAILEDRIARPTLIGLTASPRWPLGGTPGSIVRQIFQSICVDGVLDTRDIIPFITPGSIFPADTIIEPAAYLSMEVEPSTVYTAIKDICTTYGLGFALVRDQDLSKLHFIVYAGRDKTSGQRSADPVIFSPELDNLTNTTELVSIESYKNVAYVFSPTESVIVYAVGEDFESSGFTRRLLMVKVDSIQASDTETGLTIAQVLQKKGQDALLEHRRVVAFDGEIPKSGHKYGLDYRLGDVVEIRNANGANNYMRVTEQIFASDAEGDRSYPTLAIDKFFSRGTWLDDANDITWADDTDTWQEASLIY